MISVPESEGEGRTLQRLFEITQDILQAPEIGSALNSIAAGLGELFRFKYVSIVASDVPGGELYRRVLVGFSEDLSRERLGENVPRESIVKMLTPEHEVVPNCFYIPAERAQTWPFNIYTQDLPLDAARPAPQIWHERDALILVLADRSGSMLGYISVDGPRDGRVPEHETLRQMQLFVNLVGLALTNARAHQAEIERRRLLEETSRAQRDFLSMVSHEVRSPIAAINSATALLDTHFNTLVPQKRAELLAVLETSTRRLAGIFEDFLLLSRMDANTLTLRIEPVDPRAVVTESVARAQSEHPDRVFEIILPASLPPVHADAGRVVQIMTNLLSNAVKYSIAGSPIHIELTVRDDRVSFAVKDEGEPISEKYRDKLFTRFGRLGPDSDSSIGLGLYICSQLVTLMGGAIGYTAADEKNNVFWFALRRKT